MYCTYWWVLVCIDMHGCVLACFTCIGMYLLILYAIFYIDRYLYVCIGILVHMVTLIISIDRYLSVLECTYILCCPSWQRCRTDAVGCKS